MLIAYLVATTTIGSKLVVAGGAAAASDDVAASCVSAGKNVTAPKTSAVTAITDAKATIFAEILEVFITASETNDGQIGASSVTNWLGRPVQIRP